LSAEIKARIVLVTSRNMALSAVVALNRRIHAGESSRGCELSELPTAGEHNHKQGEQDKNSNARPDDVDFHSEWYSSD
jgi:hypothetical protein